MGIFRLFSREHVRFESALPSEEAARRLQGQVRSAFASHSGETLVGQVWPHDVVLRCDRPGSHNSFALRFVGRFSAESGPTLLVGVFSVSPLVQVFVCLWFVAVLAAGTAGVLSALFRPSAPVLPLPVLMAPFGMAAASLVTVLLGQRRAQGDRSHLEHAIRSALAETPAPDLARS